MTERKLTVLDLFSGIGGFSLGLERTGGFETVAFCESDEFCQKVLHKHWPTVPCHDDVRTFNATRFGRIDVITGGLPCQPFSVAGKRRGTQDNRYLWPEMLGIIETARPTWVIAENVGGFPSMALRRGPSEVAGQTRQRLPNHDFYEAIYTRTDDLLLAHVCDNLEALGYAVQPIIVPACAINAPHRRDRIWIIAHHDSARGDRLAEHEVCARRDAAESQFNSLVDADGQRQSQSQGHEQELGRRVGDGGQDVADAMCDGAGEGSGEISKKAEHSEIGAGRRRQPEPSDSGQTLANAGEPRLSESEQKIILGAGRRQEGGATTECSRRLTQSELGRGTDGLPAGLDRSLSTWPPDWEDGLDRVAVGIPNRVDRLKALGNAVVPQVVTVLGHAILEAERAA